MDSVLLQRVLNRFREFGPEARSRDLEGVLDLFEGASLSGSGEYLPRNNPQKDKYFCKTGGRCIGSLVFMMFCGLFRGRYSPRIFRNQDFPLHLRLSPDDRLPLPNNPFSTGVNELWKDF